MSPYLFLFMLAISYITQHQPRGRLYKDLELLLNQAQREDLVFSLFDN